MKNDNQNILVTIALFIGGFWLLNKILKQEKGKPGIFGFNFVRNLIPYEDRYGNEYFKKDLKNFTNQDAGYIIREIIINARIRESLSMPFYKTFSDTKITGELRSGQFRILVYQMNKSDFLMLSVFKKKTNETPKEEIRKAERRLNEFLSRK